MTGPAPLVAIVGLWALALVLHLGAPDTPGSTGPGPFFGLAVLLTLLAAGPAIHAKFFVPVVRGTWWGELRSSYADPATGRTLAPIPVALVIRQRGEKLEVCLHSRESSSVTITASLIAAPDGRRAVAGLYRNEPRLPRQDTSRIHHGAIKLQLIVGATRRLHGTYWTDRGTSGELELHLAAHTHAADFGHAAALAAANNLVTAAIGPAAGSSVEPTPEPIGDTPEGELHVTPDEAFCKLLESSVTETELRRLVNNVAPGAAGARLPGKGTTLADLAFETVGLLRREGLVDRALDQLLRDRPQRRAEIGRVRSLFRGEGVEASQQPQDRTD
jgi:hypothetical protein